MYFGCSTIQFEGDFNPSDTSCFDITEVHFTIHVVHKCLVTRACKDPPPNVARLLTTLPSKPPLSVLAECEAVEKDMWCEAAEKEGVDQKWHMRTWFWWQFGKKI
ncbi:hypothetical protein CY35_12G051400 [Sphagnum magellanicum]|nr:hypothetical protein CY35_12G051400 [Sphagnum magellanicum]